MNKIKLFLVSLIFVGGMSSISYSMYDYAAKKQLEIEEINNLKQDYPECIDAIDLYLGLDQNDEQIDVMNVFKNLKNYFINIPHEILEYLLGEKNNDDYE